MAADLWWGRRAMALPVPRPERDGVLSREWCATRASRSASFGSVAGQHAGPCSFLFGPRNLVRMDADDVCIYKLGETCQPGRCHAGSLLLTAKQGCEQGHDQQKQKYRSKQFFIAGLPSHRTTRLFSSPAHYKPSHLR